MGEALEKKEDMKKPGQKKLAKVGRGGTEHRFLPLLFTASKGHVKLDHSCIEILEHCIMSIDTRVYTRAIF